MISINRTHVDALSKQLNSKQTYGKNDAILYPILVMNHPLHILVLFLTRTKTLYLSYHAVPKNMERGFLKL